MTVLIVLAVGALACVVVGALLSTYASRRSFAALPSAFVCWLGKPAPAGSSGDPHRLEQSLVLSRRTCRAVWAHDVLVVVGGHGVTTIRPLTARFADGDVRAVRRRSRFGADADLVVLTLELDDGTHVPLAAPRAAATKAAGPFLAALLPYVATTTERRGR